jgi:hypothetical protein
MACFTAIHLFTKESNTGLRLTSIVRAPDNDTLANVITAQILKIEGIMKSETMFAFRVFSRHDLEGMFSVGIQ